MIDAREAIARLREGNRRFAAGESSRDGLGLSRRAELVAAQDPLAIVLGCSDSRVPAEIVFDQGLGDLFVIRVAGNVANNDEIASCEYAIEHFDTPVLIVLGHSSCGAVSAVVNQEHVPEDIQRMVNHIGEAVDRVRKEQPQLKGPELIAASVKANVLETIDDLKRGCAEITGRLREGKLKLLGAVYNLDDGRVAWL